MNTTWEVRIRRRRWNRGGFPAKTCTALQDLRCGEFKVGEHQFVSRAGIRDYEHVPIWNSG